MKGITSFIILLLLGCTLHLYSSAQEGNPQAQYAKLKNDLAAGWNTWNTRSVLSHVLLPSAFSLNLELVDGAADSVLREALIGRRGENVETVRPGLHSYDGAYTELTIEWRSVKVKIESAATGNNLVILITPLSQNRGNKLLLRPAMLWNKKGNIGKNKDGFIADLPSGAASVYISETVADDNFKDSLLAVSTLEKNIGISVGNKKSVPEIEKIVSAARAKAVENLRAICRLRRSARSHAKCVRLGCYL